VPVKSAILATDSTIVHYARLLILLTQGSTIKVRVFQVELLKPMSAVGETTQL